MNKYIDSENYDISESSISSNDDELNKFNSNWNIWYHHHKNNWKIDSYKKIFNI